MLTASKSSYAARAKPVCITSQFAIHSAAEVTVSPDEGQRECEGIVAQIYVTKIVPPFPFQSLITGVTVWTEHKQ